MKNNIKAVIVLLVIIIGGYFIITNKKEETVIETPAPGSQTSVPSQTSELDEPTFSWAYDPFEAGEIPRTKISIIAQYKNSKVITKEVEEVQGSCNEYSSPDKNVYKKSTMIICYYAGFGHYYKVVENTDSYVVQRKMFEEASPDYNPPQDTFKTIVTFEK